jgi:hypothetical protein
MTLDRMIVGASVLPVSLTRTSSITHAHTSQLSPCTLPSLIHVITVVASASGCVLPPGSCGSGAGTEMASDLAVHLNSQELVGIVLKLPSTCELRCRVCVSKLREYLRECQGIDLEFSRNRSWI